jgi:hypothetical protein
MIMIFEIITDGPNGLKIGQLEEFIDTKAHVEEVQAMVAASANR